jgi:hypothetical protein
MGSSKGCIEGVDDLNHATSMALMGPGLRVQPILTLIWMALENGFLSESQQRL